MAAFEKLIDALRAHGDNVTENGDKARAHCPAHNGTSDDSLAIGSAMTATASSSTATQTAIRPPCSAALGLTMADLFDDAQLKNIWQPFAKYIYPGGLEVNRRIGQNGKKTFHQSGNKTDRSLFHADHIGTAMVVYVPEGEKDCSPSKPSAAPPSARAMGAGKAHIADWSPLTGKHVIIIVDNDEPGLNHAEDIADILDGIATTVSMVRAAVGKESATISPLVRSCPSSSPSQASTTPCRYRSPEFCLCVLPTVSFPTQIADMVRGLAEATQTDAAMAGTSAITALSACAGGNVEVEIRDGWVEPLCTYCATVAESGERKSAVQRPMIDPVLDAEAELVEAMIPLRRDALAEKEVAEKAPSSESPRPPRLIAVRPT